MKLSIEIPILTKRSSNGKQTNFKGVANPKTFITNEIMLYFYGSIFVGFLVSSILNLIYESLFNNTGFGFCISIAAFIALTKLNNRFFNSDKERIRDLLIETKFETLDTILKFERDVLMALNANTIETLFKSIFKDDWELKKQVLSQSPDILRFLQSIAPMDRELIYRYYLVRSLPES